MEKTEIEGGFYNEMASSVWGKKTDIRFGLDPNHNALGSGWA